MSAETPAPQPTLNSLAAKITELSATLTQQIEKDNIPVPTFAADSPLTYASPSIDFYVTRQKLLDALSDLTYLTQGPNESIFNYVHNCLPDVTVLNVLNYFDFWAAVPLDGSASFAEIAERTRLPEEVATRLVEHAITLRIFAYHPEPSKASSRVQHSARSAALARTPGLKALVSTILDVSSTPMLVLNEALQRYSYGKTELTQDMDKTSFALFHNGELAGRFANSWEMIEKDGEGEKQGWRQRDFVKFMDYLKEIFQLEQIVSESYDWKALGEATIVDLGGSGGHDAFVLARNFPNLSINVQDLPKVQSVFEANVPAELKSRVTFTPHDFFQPQPVQADVYLIKLILHDWPDHECIKILQALRPSLRPGARVVFVEYVGKSEPSPDAPPAPRAIQQLGTSTDIRMMAMFNAKERPVSAWADIFRKADERFEIASVKAEPQTFFLVLEAIWRG